MTQPENSTSDQPPAASAKREIPDTWISLALFLIIFAVYGATACRTVYTGDDGDLITAIVTTGVPHPTGYPLFCLMGKLFLLIVPFGEPAFRINLMTAFFGASAVAMLYRFIALLTPERTVAAFCALLLAFTPTLWQQSLSCEVYSLTSFFLAAILYQAKRWSDDPADARRLKMLTFTYGLALTNHMTMALFFPAFLTFVFWKRRTLLLREGWLLLTMVGLFVLPLLLYAYIPLVATFSDAPLKWGNPVTLDAFLGHLTGRQYRGLMFQHPLDSWRQLPRVGGLLMREYGLWFLWLAPVGWWTLFRDPQNRPLNAVLTWIVGANVLYAINYDIFDIYVYFLPTYIIVACWIAVGMSRVLATVWKATGASEETRRRHRGLLIPLLLTVTITHVSLHYAETDKSDNYLESQFAANVLRTAPPNSLIFLGRGNNTFSLWYRQFVLGERPDVVCVDFSLFFLREDGDYWYIRHLQRRYPALKDAFPGGDIKSHDAKTTFAALLGLMDQATRTNHPVLVLPVTDVTDRVGAFVNRSLAPLYDRVPYGLVEWLYRKGTAPSAAALYAQTAPLWADYQTRGVYTERARLDPMQNELLQKYAQSHFTFAQVAEAAGQYPAAADSYTRAAFLIPFPDAEAGQKRCEAAVSGKR